jgi:hypothetical protein
MKQKTLAELGKLHDKLFKQLVGLQQRMDALKAAQAKPKWVKK